MLKIIASNFFVRFFSAISNLIIAIIISQFLGATGKGEQSIILASITIVLLIDNLIGGASVVYLTPRLGLKNLLITSYLWTLIISLCCYLILTAFPHFSSGHALSISILSGLNSITSINSSVLIGKEKIFKSNILNICVPVITLLTIGCHFYFFKNKSVSDYIVSLYVAYCFTALLSLIYIVKEFSKSDNFSLSEVKSTFKFMFFFGFQNQLAHIFQLLSFRISYFILEENWGKKAVGIYSNGLSIVESIWMITSSISLYQYSRISNTNDIHFSLRLTEKLTKLGLFLAFISLVFVLLIPSEFYIWLFGDDFYNLNTVIRYMAPGIWVFNYALIIGHFFSGVGKYYVNAIASFAGFLVTILFSFIIFPKLTIYNAAFTAVFSYLVTSSIVILFYLKEGGKFVLFPNLNEFKIFLNQIVNKKNKIAR